MSIEPDCVISSDSFTKYGLNDRCRISKARVQEFLDEGLMSQGEIKLQLSLFSFLSQYRCRLQQIYRGAVRETHQRQTI